MMFIPKEIWDKILIETNDLELAILYKNNHVIKKLYNPEEHTYFWCIINCNLIVFDFLVKLNNNVRSIFRTVFVDAIWFNNFEIAEYILKNNLLSAELLHEDQSLIENCFSYKTNLETILFLEKYNVKFNQTIIDEICGNCDTISLYYLIEKKYTFTELGIVNTVINGNIENLDIIIAKNNIHITSTFDLMDLACENLRLDMMKHLYRKYNIRGSDLIFEKAIITRSKKIIKWVRESHNIKQISSISQRLLSIYFIEDEIREILI